jgi:group II intron reverse transcriptase/maturase
MYVATELDESWLRNEQRKLYTRSRETPEYIFRKVWGLITDPRNLRIALARVARNKGHKTPGTDGQTAGQVLREGADKWLGDLRVELRAGLYRPKPVRRVLIPKAGQPRKFRPLGIPTIKDRVVQAALKNILEPIFEAGFRPSSHGFRPGKSVHGALAHLKMFLRPRALRAERARRLPYQWAIEGDIKGCFDHIDHHALMERFRNRVRDTKVNRLVVAFLKAGVLSEQQFLRSEAGTPQGGILSPLLANIALSAIEERYERHVWPWRTPTRLTDPKAIEQRAARTRTRDRVHGRPVMYPIRYADDFILLVSAPLGPNQATEAEKVAVQEKVALGSFLKDTLGLELSEAKSLVTPVTRTMTFLGHNVRVRSHPGHGNAVCTVVIPKERSRRLRLRIKGLFRQGTTAASLRNRLQKLNPILRGWCYFYRYAWGAKHVFSYIDHYVWWTIFRWLRKKHRRAGVGELIAQYGWRKPGRRALHWQEGRTTPFRLSSVHVTPFQLYWLHPPDFAMHSREPGA